MMFPSPAILNSSYNDLCVIILLTHGLYHQQIVIISLSRFISKYVCVYAYVRVYMGMCVCMRVFMCSCVFKLATTVHT